MTNIENTSTAWLPNLAFLIIAVSIGLGLMSQGGFAGGKDRSATQVASATLR